MIDFIDIAIWGRDFSITERTPSTTTWSPSLDEGGKGSLYEGAGLPKARLRELRLPMVAVIYFAYGKCDIHHRCVI